MVGTGERSRNTDYSSLATRGEGTCERSKTCRRMAVFIPPLRGGSRQPGRLINPFPFCHQMLRPPTWAAEPGGIDHQSACLGIGAKLRSGPLRSFPGSLDERTRSIAEAVRGLELSVIVPIYNEAGNIQPLFEQLVPAL